MNIVLLTAQGNTLVRPDTTWERDNEDFYVPEFVDRLFYSPVLFVRVSKPGRSIGEKFASRYFDACNYGVLLHPLDLLEKGEQGYACASCLDHTSFLPFPLYNPVTLGQDTNEFVLTCEEKQLFACPAHGRAVVERAIAEVSKYCYLRIGDMVAVELAEPEYLCARPDGVEVRGSFCGNETIDFKVIF